MRKITIELSKSSVDKAIDEIKQYRKELRKKYDEVCRRLAEIGAKEAQAHLNLSHGNTDATIMPVQKIDNGYKIVMSGADVYFVEYGTGDQVSSHFNPDVSVAWGSWSVGHAQKLYNNGFWWYGGEKLTGTPAEMPMYYAEKAIRANIDRVVKEVLG